jgi:hypothetical protein
MTSIQLYLAVGIPIIAILTSLTVSLLQVSAIRAEVARIHEDMRGLRADFREDMKAMYATSARTCAPSAPISTP